ncbi:MAG: translation initiation factor IF-2 [Cyanobacteria bacterium SBLK]|nr:translation initiation factor IF-2 [Cyanobacteria bacterium SBLK]
MNNGKTRIYDLSKELNLENRDILEICNRLNIAVKSHSSTITEAQVERIRAAAKTYKPPQKNERHSPSKSREERTAALKSPGPRVPRKPEIRGIVKNASRPERGSRPQPSRSNAPNGLKLVAPPSRPQKPKPVETTAASTNAANISLATPKRPVQKERNLTEQGLDPSPVSPSDPPKRPLREKSRSPKESVSATPEEKRELLGPPSRPQPPSAKKLDERPAPRKGKKSDGPRSPRVLEEAGKPAPAKSERKQSGSKPEIKPEKATASGEGKSRDGKKEGKKDKEGKKVRPVAKLQQKPQKAAVPQLRKPNAVEEISPNDLDEEVNDENQELFEETTLLAPPERPQLKLKRPNVSRKPKEWEEEEEDSEGTAGKAGKTGKAGKAGKTGKAGGKKKRKSLIIEDDEDEFNVDRGNAVAPAAVSLSIARPPKPTSNRPKSTPQAKTAKKPSVKGEKDRTKEDNRAKTERETPAKPPEKVALTGSLSLRELAELIRIPETEIIKHLFSKGIAVNITQTLDLDTVKMVLGELGIETETQEEKAAAVKSEMLDVEDLENLQFRPPVVTIMGHVDHGKTTLLDSIRKTKVAQGEAGGITQHIGAYHVDVEHNEKIQQVVFLDTPGHEAFTAMRARGTKVTDIAILVVAADDGVRPQTKEAIGHAKAAEVPLIVAINKIDKPGAEPDRVKQELAELGLVTEEWGGETIMVPVSALKGENLDSLLDMILLVAELEELSANPDRPAKGTVIEAHLDKTRGPVATLLVQNGTLRVGDCLVAGASFGKIRAAIDDRGDRVEAATPSFAVEVLGMNDVPAAGDEFEVFPTEREARAAADSRASENRETRLQQAMSRRVSLSTISAQAREGELKELNLILKADVQGSVEAILSSLEQLPQNEVQIRVLLSAPGDITETDVDLAAASGAVIVGFNTDLAIGAASAADREAVDVREYNIIYNLLDDIRSAMEGLLEPEEVEEPLGTVEVRAVFPVGKGSVAGCYVLSGKVVRNRRIRVRRKGEVLFDGVLDSLRRIKEDVREVNSGYECGIGLDKFNAWEEGDIIEAYQMVMKRRTLSPV